MWYVNQSVTSKIADLNDAVVTELQRGCVLLTTITGVDIALTYTQMDECYE